MLFTTFVSTFYGPHMIPKATSFLSQMARDGNSVTSTHLTPTPANEKAETD